MKQIVPTTIRPNIKFSLLPHQVAMLALKNDYDLIIYSGGLGSGKSYFLAVWVYAQTLIHAADPESNKHLVVGSDRALIKTEIFPTFRTMLAKLNMLEGVHYELNLTDFSLKLPWATILFKSAQNGVTAFQGYSIKSLAIDEIGSQPDEIVEEAHNRLRGSDKNLTALHVGVPQYNVLGAHWQKCTSPDFKPVAYYEVEGRRLVRAKINKAKKEIIVFGSTHENPHSGQSYIRKQKQRFGYNPKVFDNQIHGLFEATSSDTVFYFDYTRNVKNRYIDRSIPEYYVALDFNLGRTSALVGYKTEGSYYIVKELVEKDTQQLVIALMRLLPANEFSQHRIYITGDSNGWRGTKHGIKSEYQLIYELLKLNYQGVKIISPKSNSVVSVTIHNVNSKLAPNELTGELESLYINESCENLISGLMWSQSDGKGGIYKPDNGKDELSHLPDCLRYFVEAVDPSSKRTIGSV